MADFEVGDLVRHLSHRRLRGRTGRVCEVRKLVYVRYDDDPFRFTEGWYRPESLELVEKVAE